MKLHILTTILCATAIFSFAEVASQIQPLATMAGEWKLQGDVFNHETGVWKKFETQSVITPILKGRYLQEEITMPQGVFAKEEMPFIITYSFDKFKKVYRMTVLDDTIGLLDIFEGVMVNGQLQTANNKTTAPAQPDGKIIANRNTLSNLTADAFDSYWEASDDGGKTWHPLLRMKYVRSLVR